MTLARDIQAAFLLPLNHRRPFLRTLRQELLQRYAGSIMGPLWFFVAPMLFLAFYASIYLLIYKIKPADLDPAAYVLYIFAGITLFLAFAEGLALGANALVQNRVILLNAVFPVELLPIRSALASHLPALIGTAIAVAVSLALGRLSWAVVLLPLVLACQAIFLAGVVCIVSPLALVVRDVAEIVRFATMMLLVISPIAYLPSGTDGAINLLVSLNPLSHFIMAYQKILVFSEAPSLGALAAMIAISLSVYAAGFVFLHRVKPALGEYAT